MLNRYPAPSRKFNMLEKNRVQQDPSYDLTNITHTSRRERMVHGSNVKPQIDYCTAHKVAQAPKCFTFTPARTATQIFSFPQPPFGRFPSSTFAFLC